MIPQIIGMISDIVMVIATLCGASFFLGYHIGKNTKK